MKLSRKICDCAQSPIRKFYPYAVAAQQRGIRIHQLNIGQPDIQTPPAFFEAIEAGRRDVLAYAESPGIPALLEAIRAYYARIGASFETQDILVTTGGSEALLMAMLCILDEGDEVLIPEPYYPNYFTFIRMAGGRVHPIPTSPEDGYRYAERARIEPHITEKTRAILLSNPGNPTGTVLTPAELRLMADIASEHGLYLICDEVYREFIYTGSPYITACHLEGIEQNVVLIDSVSKRYSECGIRIGALITKNKTLRNAVMKFCQARLSPPLIGQIIAEASIDAPRSYSTEVYEEYIERRKCLIDGLNRIPGVYSPIPMGAFYTVARLPVDDSDKFCAWCLSDFEYEGETVMMAPASGFYSDPECGRNEVRIAYVLKKEDLERALLILGKALDAYNARK